jgi:hypothetical protein
MRPVFLCEAKREGKIGFTSSFDIKVCLVELGDEFGEGREITVHCSMVGTRVERC